MKNEETFSPDQIQAITAEEWMQKMLVDRAKVDLLYVIMGCLQEYFGGYEVSDDQVDVFFVGGTQKALTVKNICQTYLKENQLENDVDLMFANTGHSFLKSKTICAKLKAHYTKALPPFLNHQCYQLSENDDLFKPAEELEDSVEFFNIKQYSFLIGVFIRYKQDEKNGIAFANASHKVQMTIDFLKQFHAFGSSSMTVKYNFGTPDATSIELEENNLFWKVVSNFVEEQIQKNI